jgi:ubiquinone/menaquinone biosynthesis C-methylase UbiE
LGIYAKYLLPRITHYVCGLKPHMRQREKIVPLATGRVLEVGAGSGLNMPYYNGENVEALYALDPSEESWALAGEGHSEVGFPVDYFQAGADEIPLEDAAVDTVLITYALCTIPDLPRSLAEMRRVLRPGGKLLFCEHGMAPDEAVRRWQNRLNPLWKKVGGGCNLNRDIPAILEQGGFTIKELETIYLTGWKPASFNFWGTAV